MKKKRSQIILRIPEGLKNKFKRWCRANETKMSPTIVKYIVRVLNEETRYVND